MPEIEIPVATDNETPEETRASSTESEEVQTSPVGNESSAESSEADNETETSEEEKMTIGTNENGDIVLPEL